MVIMTGVFFAATAPESELHEVSRLIIKVWNLQLQTAAKESVLSTTDEVEKVMGGVWIFGQLILFSMQLGSKRCKKSSWMIGCHCSVVETEVTKGLEAAPHWTYSLLSGIMCNLALHFGHF